MNSTDHPKAAIAEMMLGTVAHVCLTDWREGNGIPEITSQVISDTLTRIITERALERGGVDVFWNDLVCTTKEQAALAVLNVAEQGIDLEALYGPNYQAIVGLLEGAALAGPAEIGAMGFQLKGVHYATDYEKALRLAYDASIGPMTDRILSDVQLACHKEIRHSPASVQRHLLGVRAVELTALYYILKGAAVEMDEDFELGLTKPMRAYIFPDAPRV